MDEVLGSAIEIACNDGVVLKGNWWLSARKNSIGVVIINPATGVLARYYHHYARFLSLHGFEVLTYDYRGIGLSRPGRLAGCGYDWRQWGELDFDSVMRHAMQARPGLPVSVVGHSIGGVLPGYATNASHLHRILTVGAQYAYWRDYLPGRRMRLFMKWHLLMPGLTALIGYFPGRALNWLEDLPAGVAYQWGLGRERLESRLKPREVEQILARFASVAAPILAIGVSDDEFGTRPAISRAAAYFSGAEVTKVMLAPGDIGRHMVGHFDLFHARHAAGFWLDTLLWLGDGINPWPDKRFD
ncbi:MAG: alpha/beta hydrolase [Rhizobium sp.]|nr:alpha/beta hydrolase [Rhizobium sp.]